MLMHDDGRLLLAAIIAMLCRHQTCPKQNRAGI
ncbi:hypothetical protein NCHU2750_41380 (plasmid) [Neorhizobium sp. NCHU2750]|nr:hypothetical protein NCHU2750_41380 [Neorhizobium sp. NCHU2750]